MFEPVAVAECRSYLPKVCAPALRGVIEAIDGLDFVKPGMKIGIKVNLIAALKPERAATTHFELVCALCDLIREKGATPIVGDSPGGAFSSPALKIVYRATGMTEAERHGALLNSNFSQKEARFEEAKEAKTFAYTAWLDDVDAIINFAKLKTHGMMGMTAAVKNLFGTVPGSIKPEYHFRFPGEERFASMLIDLNEYFKPQLNLIDAVIGMEGNGPTAGTPRAIGALIASRSPYCADLLAAKLIGISDLEAPTVRVMKARGLCPQSVEGLEIRGDYAPFVIEDYGLIANRRSLEVLNNPKTAFGRVLTKSLRSVLAPKPVVLKESCVRCGKCAEVCPAGAVAVGEKPAKIDRSKCIRCFCCQEFCPKGAIEVHRPAIARIASRF